MDSVTRALETEDVEAHGKWVRSLARGLLTEGEAEDLAQDVWVAILETGGGKPVRRRKPCRGCDPGSIRKPKKTEP